MDEKLHLFLMAMRESLTNQLAGIEDCLETPYDKSVLARRQSKVRQYGKGQETRSEGKGQDAFRQERKDLPELQEAHE